MGTAQIIRHFRDTADLLLVADTDEASQVFVALRDAACFVEQADFRNAVLERTLDSVCAACSIPLSHKSDRLEEAGKAIARERRARTGGK